MRAFLFPGQGSQRVGMAADLFRTDAGFRDLVKFASAQVGEDLERVCQRGPDKLLQRTPLLQPLLVAVSLGYLRHLTAHGLRPDVMLGHSLGEITALAASGVLTFEEAVIVAAKRGALMEQSAAKVRGGMLAVCP
jgi:[acyl-carrier-protein] S-malonyltransferase